MKVVLYVLSGVSFIITLGGILTIADGDTSALTIILAAIFAALGVFLILKGNKIGKAKKQRQGQPEAPQTQITPKEPKAPKAKREPKAYKTEKMTITEKLDKMAKEAEQRQEELKQKQYEERRKKASPYIDPDRIDAEGFENPIAFPNVITKKDEAVYYAVPARYFTTKEKVTGYNRGSMGVSVKVAKGVTLRPGAGKAKAIREDVTSYADGVFVVTNQRVLFMGQKDNFEIPIKKISALNPVSETGFMICYGNYQKGIEFDETTVNYATMAIQEMVNRL